MKKKTAVIIGAGPAGLTAAYELLRRTEIHPIVIEKDPHYVGGISKTVNYKGNRIDIGGHRFFSKSDRVMRWWSEILPVRLPHDSENVSITYHRSVKALTEGMRHATEKDGIHVFEVRPRKTRIIHKNKFYTYPIELSVGTLSKLGIAKTIRIGFTYLWSTLFPRRPETTLEDFFINRFGSELYQTFFKSYTEKVWGVSCKEMSSEWGAQRVKGLSILKAIAHAVKKTFSTNALSGKGVETSLIEQFLYPPLGPGQLWERVAESVRNEGGDIRMGSEVVGCVWSGNRIQAVSVRTQDGVVEEVASDYVFSTTDIPALIQMLGKNVPKSAQTVADGLEFRDFLTVGLLLEKKPEESDGTPLLDTWMYVHEDNVHVGRIQFFHNWHPSLVSHTQHGWIGLEYFCNTTDSLWRMSDANLIELAKQELNTIGIGKGLHVLDGTVIREPKAYPGYFGSYKNFDTVRNFLDGITNLYPIGRNGMHRYNNQDHSMLAAFTAVDLIVSNNENKSVLWNINTEEEYHEQKN